MKVLIGRALIATGAMNDKTNKNKVMGKHIRRGKLIERRMLYQIVMVV